MRRFEGIYKHFKRSVPQELEYEFVPEIRLCCHVSEPVRIGSWEVAASSLTDRRRKRGEWVPPDLGIYLDTDWAGILPVITSPNSYFLQRKYTGGRVVVVNWPDFGVIPTMLLSQLVELAVRAMRKGELVEVGCAGGHGRTGTFLACLLVRVEDLFPLQSVKEVRSRYCERAVEAESQVMLVQQYYERRIS